MKKWHAGLLGLTLTSALALSANAGDTYSGGLKDGPPPPYVLAATWNGFYAGFNGGYGEPVNNGPSSFPASDLHGGPFSPSGGFGGGQIGYNWQGLFGYSPWVIGIESDIQGAGISDSYDGYTMSLNWFGTVRGRLGYAFGPALIYATGGFAYGEVENKGRNDAGLPYDVSETQTGYVVGAGAEYKFNPAWSVKAEYQFISLDATFWNGAHALDGSSSDRSEVNTFRIGVNYHLGGSGFGPLY